MSDPLSEYLISTPHHATISPEMLERLGKEAASQYLTTGVGLNKSIVKLASAFNDINAEQIKRIVEFANNAVYLSLHDKNKTAGAGASYPQFDLADADSIVQDLSEDAKSMVVQRVSSDYSISPEYKSKHASAEDEALFEQAFLGKVKTASPDFSKDTAVEEVMSLKDALVGLKNQLEHSGEQFDMLQKEAQEEYYTHTKQFLLEGNEFSGVLVAAQSTGMPKEKVANLLQPVLVRLLKEKVASARDMKKSLASFHKIAHRVINPEHPLVKFFGAMSAFENEIEKTATALQEVDEQLDAVREFIKTNFGG